MRSDQGASAADLDVASIDREREAVRRVVGAEGGRGVERTDPEESRDVRRGSSTLTVVGDVPPRAEPDERRVIRYRDRAADPCVGADHGETGHWAARGERRPILDVAV